MIIKIDGYAIFYDKSHSKITISLPETNGVARTTVLPFENRRIDITKKELVSILLLTIQIFRGIIRGE